MRKKMNYPKGVWEIRDSGPDSYADRYTVVYNTTCDDSGAVLCDAVSMSAAPFWPQGYCQHCSARPGRHLGKRITFEALPVDCREVVSLDLGMEA